MQVVLSLMRTSTRRPAKLKDEDDLYTRNSWASARIRISHIRVYYRISVQHNWSSRQYIVSLRKSFFSKIRFSYIKLGCLVDFFFVSKEKI